MPLPWIICNHPKNGGWPVRSSAQETLASDISSKAVAVSRLFILIWLAWVLDLDTILQSVVSNSCSLIFESKVSLTWRILAKRRNSPGKYIEDNPDIFEANNKPCLWPLSFSRISWWVLVEFLPTHYGNQEIGIEFYWQTIVKRQVPNNGTWPDFSER